ncbi:MAG: AIPR family protein [Candidatus Sulfotelmatobacter sp.]|jgi:hypothetical protein
MKSHDVVKFPFHSFRNITCPEDLANERKVFSGQAPVTSVLPLSTDENVRHYLLDAEGKERRRPTQVNLEIKDTLEKRPNNFSILNGGIVIVARGHDVDEQKKTLRLTDASIINGSQTQGVLRDFFQKISEGDLEPPDIHVKYELIVTDDEDLIAEISIARNFQNDVANLSIAGRRKQLDELEESLRESIPGAKLRKSETQLSEDYVATERLLQVITALVPAELWPNQSERESPNKVFTYSMKAKCLKEFLRVWKAAHDPRDPDPSRAKEQDRSKRLYDFYLQIAPQAHELYEKWKAHQGFAGTGIRSIARNGREILEVPDGIIFPILASLSAFAKETSQGWAIKPPKVFKDEEVIRAAKSVYQNIANSNPWLMGKSKACYAALYQITSIYQRLSD